MCSAPYSPRPSVLPLPSLSTQSWRREPSREGSSLSGRESWRGAGQAELCQFFNSTTRTSKVTLVSGTCDSWLMGGSLGPGSWAKKKLNSKTAEYGHNWTSPSTDMFQRQPGTQLGNVAGLAQTNRYSGGKPTHRMCHVGMIGRKSVCLVMAWNLRLREDSIGFLDALKLVISKSPLPPLPLPRSSFGWVLLWWVAGHNVSKPFLDSSSRQKVLLLSWNLASAISCTSVLSFGLWSSTEHASHLQQFPK